MGWFRPNEEFWRSPAFAAMRARLAGLGRPLAPGEAFCDAASESDEREERAEELAEDRWRGLRLVKR